MLHKKLFACLTIPFLYVLSFFGYHDSFEYNGLNQGREEYRVSVKLINEEWRVVLSDNESQSDVTLRRGDRIRWRVEGSDVTFSFPETEIFGLKTRTVKRGNRLTLPIMNDSPLGEFPYEVYIHDADTYARGQSPPRIIIRE